MSLVQVRTPTYRRPEALARALRSLQGQTWQDWVCDVYDDDPEGSARAVVEALGDGRIHYHRNAPQRYASRNIDACFARDNPRGAAFFCVVEDDNFLLPDFMEANIALIREKGVGIVLRNQLFEWRSGTAEAKVGPEAVLDGKFLEGRYTPALFRLAMVADIGVSNGGLFWSRGIQSDLEIGFGCTATMQEYMRTYALEDDIWVAMEPMAVWAENGEGTLRDMGDRARYLRRELDLKRSLQVLRRRAWARAGAADRAAYVRGEAFAYPAGMRIEGLARSFIRAPSVRTLGLRKAARIAARAVAIRALGRTGGELERFIASRGG